MPWSVTSSLRTQHDNLQKAQKNSSRRAAMQKRKVVQYLSKCLVKSKMCADADGQYMSTMSQHYSSIFQQINTSCTVVFGVLFEIKLTRIQEAEDQVVRWVALWNWGTSRAWMQIKFPPAPRHLVVLLWSSKSWCLQHLMPPDSLQENGEDVVGWERQAVGDLTSLNSSSVNVHRVSAKWWFESFEPPNISKYHTKLPPTSNTWGLFSGEVELRDAEFEVDPLRKLLLGTLPFTWEVSANQQQLQMLGFPSRRWPRIKPDQTVFVGMLTHILSFERFLEKIWVHSVFIPFLFPVVYHIFPSVVGPPDLAPLSPGPGDFLRSAAGPGTLERPAEPCGAGEGGEAASAGGAQKDGIGLDPVDDSTYKTWGVPPWLKPHGRV